MADRPGDPTRTAAQQAGDAAETLVADAPRGGRLDRPGPERPCRSPRARPRGDRPGPARRARRRRGPLAADAATFGLPEETVDHRKRARLRAAALRPARARAAAGRRRPLPRLPLRFDLVVVEPAPGRRVARHPAPSGGASDGRRPARCGRTRATLRRGRGADLCDAAPQNHPPAPVRGAEHHTRTVPTGTVPAQRRRRREPAPGDEVRGGTNRTGGRSPCRPSRCGSCSRPESTSATRPAAGTPRCARSSSRSATGSTSSISPRPSQRLDVALDFVRETVARGEQVLFVGTKKQAQEPIAQEATRAGHAVRQQALARRHADQLRHDQEADRAARAARGAPAGRRLRADDQEGSRQADRGDDQAPGARSAACAR